MLVDLFSNSVTWLNLLDASYQTYGTSWINCMGRPGVRTNIVPTRDIW